MPVNKIIAMIRDYFSMNVQFRVRQIKAEKEIIAAINEYLGGAGSAG